MNRKDTMTQHPIDFSEWHDGYRCYYGTENKRSIESPEGTKYLLKLPGNANPDNSATKPHDAAKIYAEYVGSRIIQTLDIPVHHTLIGSYQNRPAVSCEDFESGNDELHEIDWYIRTVSNDDKVRYDIRKRSVYEQITYAITQHPTLQPIKTALSARYRENLIIDLLLGNVSRNTFDFGILINEHTRTVRLAPIYANNKGLYSELSENSMTDLLKEPENLKRFIEEKSEPLKNIITKDRQSFMEAAETIYPKINMERIRKIINETPFISDVRKTFYCAVIAEQKNQVRISVMPS